MNKPNPVADAIGVVKLASMHHNNPGAVSAETVRDAANECIQRLEAIPPRALDLAALYCALFAIMPEGLLPYVTLTGNATYPFGAVIADEANNVAATGIGKSVEGLTAIIATKLSRPMAGCGEVAQ